MWYSSTWRRRACCLLRLLYREDGRGMFLWNAIELLHDYRASHIRRQYSSRSLLLEPQIQHISALINVQQLHHNSPSFKRYLGVAGKKASADLASALWVLNCPCLRDGIHLHWRVSPEPFMRTSQTPSQNILPPKPLLVPAEDAKN